MHRRRMPSFTGEVVREGGIEFQSGARSMGGRRSVSGFRDMLREAAP